jgi:hypothetical protein
VSIKRSGHHQGRQQRYPRIKADKDANKQERVQEEHRVQGKPLIGPVGRSARQRMAVLKKQHHHQACERKKKPRMAEDQQPEHHHGASID